MNYDDVDDGEPQDSPPSSDGSMDEFESDEVSWGFEASASREFDAEYDRVTPTESDGRSGERTTFNPKDVSAEDRGKWERLRKWNDGVGDPERSVHNLSANQRRDAKVFASSLGFSSTMKSRLLHVVEACPPKEVNRRASWEAVCLSVLTLVANEWSRAIRQEDEYETLRESLGVERSTVRRLRQDVRDHEGYQNVGDR